MRNQKYLDIALKTLNLLKTVCAKGTWNSEFEYELDGLTNQDYLIARVSENYENSPDNFSILIRLCKETGSPYPNTVYYGALCVRVEKDKISIERDGDLKRDLDLNLLNAEDISKILESAYSDLIKYNYVRKFLDNKSKLEKFRVYLKYIRQNESLTGLKYSEIDELITESQKLIPAEQQEVFDEIMLKVYGCKKHDNRYDPIYYGIGYNGTESFIYYCMDNGLINNIVENKLNRRYSDHASKYYKTDNLTEK